MLTWGVLFLFDNSYAHTRFNLIWLRGCEEEKRNVDSRRSVLTLYLIYSNKVQADMAQEVVRKRRGMLARGVLLLLDNPYVHTRFKLIWIRRL